MKKYIAVFCGSFNPPLNSHCMLAEHVVNECAEIEKVIFVPVSDKYNKENLIKAEHRYNMLKLICDKNEKFEVSNIEFDLERQPYTIETLNRLQEMYTENQIIFLTGSDNLAKISTWYEAEELLRNFRILVLSRDEDDVNSIIESNELLRENKNTFIILNSELRTNLSSNFVRQQIKDRKSIKYLLPQEVLQYIETNNLYR